MAHAEKSLQRLADLCTIQSGLSVRGKLETSPEGDAPVILLRDTADGRIDPGNLERAYMGDADERYRARPGDILFRTRFEPNIAIHLTDVPRDAIVIAPLMLLRATAQAIDPAYLAWYINQPPVQAKIARDAQGTNLRMVPRDVLAALPISYPDLESQKRIVEIEALSRREGELMNMIGHKRQDLVRNMLLDRVADATHERKLAATTDREGGQ